MIELRKYVIELIRSRSFPERADDFLAGFYDKARHVFTIQESLHWDYKDAFPSPLSGEYFGGILRLICAFFNTFGGLIVFGVDDKSRSIVGNKNPLDIERLNHVIRQKLNEPIECIHKQYLISNAQGTIDKLDVILVPKRPIGIPPARFVESIGKYPKNRIYRRIGHEVIEAQGSDLAILYGSREDFGLESTPEESAQIESLLPPAPSTIKEYVPRPELMDRLWSWLVFDDDPRYFLFGRGGSGKSTLAYDFAARIAEDGGSITVRGNRKIDFVLFLSAKERYLDIGSATIRPTQATDFANNRELYHIIINRIAGDDIAVLAKKNKDEIKKKIREIFDNFFVLLVIDDIDTLMTKGLDPGMDFLYRNLLRSAVGGKILYTMRQQPLSSLDQSTNVPGLDPDTEYLDFVNTCCRQFKTPQPDVAWTVARLGPVSEYLPLVVETIIGFRRTCSNYNEALSLWESKRADEAREYLFRREYDRLNRDNRARHLLAALAILVNPVPTATLSAVLQFSPEALKDALSEVADLFVQTIFSTEGETTFTLGAVTRAFVLKASKSLPLFDVLQQRVQLLKARQVSVPPALATILFQVEKRLKEQGADNAREYLNTLELPTDLAEHPKFKALDGEVYSKQSPPEIEKARACFKLVWDTGHASITMMRSWYYLERERGLFREAEDVCNRVLASDRFNDFAKSEFWSKLGAVYRHEARTLRRADDDLCMRKYIAAISAHIEAVAIGIANPNLSLQKSEQYFFEGLNEAVLNAIVLSRHEEILSYFAGDKVKWPVGADFLAKSLEQLRDRLEFGRRAVLEGRRGAVRRLRGKIEGNQLRFREKDNRHESIEVLSAMNRELEQAISRLPEPVRRPG